MLVVSLVLLLFAFLLLYSQNYWRIRKFPQIYGFNLKLLSSGFQDLSQIYSKISQRNFTGIYILTRPILILTSPRLINTILNEHHDHFSSTATKIPTDPDFFLWKSKITPQFQVKASSVALRECLRNVVGYVDEHCRGHKKKLDVVDVVENLVRDFVWLWAFRVKCNSFRKPRREVGEGRGGGWERLVERVRMVVGLIAPGFVKVSDSEDLSTFYLRTLQEMLRQMESQDGKKKSVNDFLGLPFRVYTTGFQPLKTTICHALHELASNDHIQSILRNDLEDTSGKKPPEESVYLEHVFMETLRLYPPLPTLRRCCTKSYRIPGTPCIIEEGTVVVIPVECLHRDAKYHQRPEVFDPGRFSRDFRFDAFLPFGRGPLGCVGKDLVEVFVKTVLAVMVRRYRFKTRRRLRRSVDKEMKALYLVVERVLR